MYWEVLGNHMPVSFTPWPPVMGQTGVIKLQFFKNFFLLYYTAFRAFGCIGR